MSQCDWIGFILKIVMKINFTLLLVLSVFLMSCEPDFVGDGVVDVTKINLPYEMKEVTIAGDPYLGVVNTNYKPIFDPPLLTGSLHFYDITNPNQISRNETLDLEIPSNASDFGLVTLNSGVQRLVVLDRNENEILLYDLIGGEFERVERLDGLELVIDTFANPQSLVAFTGEPNNTAYVAVLCQSGGTVQFFNVEETRNFDDEDLDELAEEIGETNPNDGRSTIEFISQTDRVGASFEMLEKSGIKLSGISSREARGRNIGKLMSFDGGANGPVLVTASYTDEALFGFRFNAFDNTSNLLWDPNIAINGQGTTQGTKEQGFRGMDMDDNGVILLSSRAENSLYRVPFAQVNQDRSNGRNTTFFGRDETDYRLDLSFDSDPTDKVFPRLSDLVVRPDGTRTFVIGLESRDNGFDQSRVYLVGLDDPDNPQLLDTTAEADFEAGDRPQKLFYDADSDVLIVAVTDANRLQVYDVSGDTFSLISTVENP